VHLLDRDGLGDVDPAGFNPLLELVEVDLRYVGRAAAKQSAWDSEETQLDPWDALGRRRTG